MAIQAREPHLNEEDKLASLAKIARAGHAGDGAADGED